MKKSKSETAKTRRRIVEVAAEAFKCNGIHATKVSEIMARVGLTHGGFYRHFSSKEELVAEACAASMNAIVDSAEAAIGGGNEAFLKHLENFLSDEYHEECPGGCPLVAIGSELARADMDTRRAVSQGFQELIDVIATRIHPDGGITARDNATFTLSSMIGAVTMSRIIDEPGFSLQILDVAKKHLATLSSEVQTKLPAKSIEEMVE
ncbi:hypothetical protein BK653_02780 [Pseudomonas brassicacearum]|uniref:TetR/AcrR family transcriptional regulator n=1 Tax=Pseudomonas brassicacearum TaxID=930166 RepID=UPI000F4AD093|nr:TetR/AcrR family transcriptional regulator [Pseudomonas brassicacearum]ROM70826.1 hypothetical protein BK653_02780 [Pseudomonas brassicacearum]